MRRPRLRLLPWPVILLAPAAAGAEPLFPRGEEVPLSAPASWVTLADLNGDGRIDAAAALPSGRVSVHLGRSDGTLGTPAEYPVGLSPVFIASGKLDGDGFPDLLVVESGSSAVSTLLNRGDGSFSRAGRTPVGTGPRMALLEDFNGDGSLDVVTSNFASFDLTLLLGDGRGGFQAGPRIEVKDNPHSLAAGDFDGDGRFDVIVAHRAENRPAGSVARFQNRGDGKFDPPVETDLTPVKAVPRWLAAGDFDRDGRQDLTVITNEGVLLLLQNLGDGPFAIATAGRTEGVPNSPFEGFLSSVDLDGDTLRDFVVPLEKRGEHGLRLFQGHGDGTFPVQSDIFLDYETAMVSFADLDGDGVLDAVASNIGAASLSIYRGAGLGALRTRGTFPLPGFPYGMRAIARRPGSSLDLAVLGSSALTLFRREASGGYRTLSSVDFPGSVLRDFLVADLDGDGRQEIALADRALGKVRIVSLDEEGKLESAVEREVGLLPSRVAAARFDGDASLDLALADQGRPAVRILLGSGVEPLEVPSGTNATALLAADVDGDGSADLCVSSQEGLRIAFGDGKGAFPRSILYPDLSTASALRGADLDRDGLLDLAAVLRKRIVLLHGAPGGGERRRETIEMAEEVRLLEIADLDGDGRLDLATVTSRSVLVLRGRADGRFDGPEAFPVGSTPTALVIADLDGDGSIDGATANGGSWTVSILAGRGAEKSGWFRRGDTDSSGLADLTDAVALLGSLFLGRGSVACGDAADADDSGELSVSDAVVLLGYLFLGQGQLPAPGPLVCGSDPSPDPLGCAAPAPCP